MVWALAVNTPSDATLPISSAWSGALVVEVDGGHHTEDDQMAHDERRDRWLEAEGYRVMRVPSIDVFQNFAGVVDSIWAALQELPDAHASRHPHQERHRT